MEGALRHGRGSACGANDEIRMSKGSVLPSSFPSFAWERTCGRNSVAWGALSAAGGEKNYTIIFPPATHSLHAKRSFVPKRSLGTREGAEKLVMSSFALRHSLPAR